MEVETQSYYDVNEIISFVLFRFPIEGKIKTSEMKVNW